MYLHSLRNNAHDHTRTHMHSSPAYRETVACHIFFPYNCSGEGSKTQTHELKYNSFQLIVCFSSPLSLHNPSGRSIFLSNCFFRVEIWTGTSHCIFSFVLSQLSIWLKFGLLDMFCSLCFRILHCVCSQHACMADRACGYVFIHHMHRLFVIFISDAKHKNNKTTHTK